MAALLQKENMRELLLDLATDIRKRAGEYVVYSETVSGLETLPSCISLSSTEIYIAFLLNR